MKCLNMNIGEVLLFVLNFVLVYQEDAKKYKTSQMATLLNASSNVDRDCPQLSKIIHDINLSDYKVHCTSFKKSDEVNIENVLQQASSIVSDMLDFICDKKINVTGDLFKQNNFDSICPFNFSHLEHLNFTTANFKLLNELQYKDHCLATCSDLSSNRTVCILLSKLNNFFKSFSQPKTSEDTSQKLMSEVNEPPAKFEQTKISVLNISEGITTKQKLETSGNKLIEPIMNATKSVKDKAVTLATEEQKSDYKTLPSSKNYLVTQENNEPISENKNLNEEKILNNDNEEDINQWDYSLPEKVETGPSLSKMESSDVKINSSPKQKEIYSGEGFFSAEDSHFFFYLIMVSSIIAVGYIAFHNKNKILAYALEGTSGRRSRRRPNPARYRKLETNLEEVISSSTTSAAASSVVY